MQQLLEILVSMIIRFVVLVNKCSVVCHRVFMGSNSDYVLHNATCPVAVVRHVEEDLKVHDPLSSSGGSRKVVIAVDESREVLCLSVPSFKVCTQ